MRIACRHIQLFAIPSLLAVSVLFLVSCGSPQSSAKLSVATILGATGQNSAYSQKMQQGLELATEEINAQGGIDHKQLNLVIQDSQWNPAKGVSIYRQLYDLQGVHLFSAICGSTVALAVCENSRNDDIVIVDAISTAPTLTDRGGKHYFRVCASDAMAGQNNVTWALETGSKTFAVIYVQDEWGTSYQEALLSSLKKAGLSATAIPVALGARDLRAEIQKILPEKPEAVFLVVYANIGVPFVQQAKSLGLGSRIYGGDNLNSSDFVGAGNEAIEGVRLSLPAEPSSEKYKMFQRAYSAKFSQEPDVFSLKSYDALHLLAFATKQVGTDPAAIIKYLESLNPPYEGASGPISFDESHDLAQQKYARMVYHNGELVECKE